MSAAPGSNTLMSLQRRSDNSRFSEMDAAVMPALHALKLDLKRSTYIGTKADLICFLIDFDHGARKREPAMLIVNKRTPKDNTSVVLLSQLWTLIDPDIPDDPIATKINRKNQRADLTLMAQQLYGFVMRDAEFRVLDAVFDFAEDLKNAKPPPWMSYGQWLTALAEDDMTLFQNGEAKNR